MFESAELNHKIDKKTFEKELPVVRDELLAIQYQLKELGKFPVVIIIGGVDGAGKGEVVNQLNEWMDPRYIQTHAYGESSEEESTRPPMWRFWRDLPPKGKIGIFFGSWYTSPIVDHVLGNIKKGEFESQLDEIIRFERMLVDEGAVVLKFWMHLSKDAQKRRLKSLEKDPKTRWRVTKEDWKRFKIYDKFRKISEAALRQTSIGDTPWFVVEGSDDAYRSLTVAKTILQKVQAKLEDLTEKKRSKPKKVSTLKRSVLIPSIDRKNVIDDLDLTVHLSKTEYKKQLEKHQGKLNLLSRDPRFKKISLIVLFEGNDAAGKGGSIRRVTGALDARFCQVTPVAAPTQEELAQPYLWRFWRHVPRMGRVTIFDRSWYGRVLVERVEGYCSENDWMRAYGEINDFENQMASKKIILVKFWLTVTKEEQLKRFKNREKTSFKNFKITEDDWRNRDKWDEYKEAVCDMVDRTSTAKCPWYLIESNDKYYGRIKILKQLCKTIELELGKIK